MGFKLKKIIMLFLIISGLGLLSASAPLFSFPSFAGEVGEPGDGDEGEDDIDDEDNEEDEDDEDEEQEDDPGNEEEQREPLIPDDAGLEPHETIEALGYKNGYSLGREDGLYDCFLKEGSEEKRRCQLNDPGSLYHHIMDEEYTVSYNAYLGYPEEYLPVSGNQALSAYQRFADKWKEGYGDGYKYNLEEGADEEWYSLGHTFGYIDAVNDSYDPGQSHGDDERIVENGYYEPDYEDSLYNTLTGRYGDAYRDGYDAGWGDGIKEYPAEIEYGSPEFDPWRISTCPLNWDTADRYVVQVGMMAKNAWYSISDRAFLDSNGSRMGGRTAAYSPFDYFFVDTDTYILDGQLKDRKKDSLISHVNTKTDAGGNWLFRAVDAGNGLYILIRYQVGDHAGYNNFKVKRFNYGYSKGDRGEIIKSTVIDSVNDYYNGNEPVVYYDSRLVTDAERKYLKDEVRAGKNTRSKRREICADAILCYWEEGKDAVPLGEIRVKAKVKNNREASVSSDNVFHNGDPYIAGNTIEEKERFYRVSADRALDGNDEEKESFGSVSFAPATFSPLLTKEENKKFTGEGPSFTLKVRSVDKDIRKYKKSVEQALKNEVFRFEIARFNLTKPVESEDKFSLYHKPFSYDSALARKVSEMQPEQIRRRDFDSFEEYEAAKKKYDEALKELNEYLASKEFKSGFDKELKEARKAYLKEYEDLKARYGKDMASFNEYLKEHELPLYNSYTYVRKYSEGYFKDGNKDGTVTPMEQWEYENVYGPYALNDLDNYHFNGVLDPGENVIPDADAWNAVYEETPDILDVSWLSGQSFCAVTKVFLDYKPGDFYGDSGEEETEPSREPNLEYYTENEDIRVSFGSARLKKQKGKEKLEISPSFIIMSGFDEENANIRTSRKKILKVGDKADLRLTDKELSGQSILIVDGINGFEGSLAVRRRENGEIGYGEYISDSRNYIESLSS